MNKLTAAVASSPAQNVSKRAAFVAIAAASLSLVSMSASAQIEAPQQRVDFGDLDLTRDQDTKRLYRRLRAAASEVCSHFNDHSGSMLRARRSKCEGQALENAVAAIDHPSLTALHTSKSDMKLAQGKAKSEPHS